VLYELFTAGSGEILEKLILSQLLKMFTEYRTRTFITAFTKATHLFLFLATLSQSSSAVGTQFAVLL
jgi:hypothetical protein